MRLQVKCLTTLSKICILYYVFILIEHSSEEMTIVVRQVTSAIWLQCCMLTGEFKWYIMNEQVQWSGII